MTQMFNKVKGGNQLFSKVKTGPTAFHKTIRKVDNSVGRVGDFISAVADVSGFPAVGYLTRFASSNAVHGTRHALEKATHADMDNVRDTLVV